MNKRLNITIFILFSIGQCIIFGLFFFLLKLTAIAGLYWMLGWVIPYIILKAIEKIYKWYKWILHEKTIEEPIINFLFIEGEK